jgi:hypothetical protein
VVEPVTPEKWGPEPEPFPWDSIPSAEERYVAFDAGLLVTLRELADLAFSHPDAIGTIRAIMRIATIDPHGRVVVGLKVVRSLDDH